jgi:outer membrane protein assembly factor BamB
VWTAKIGVLGFCPPCGQGSISPSAFDGTKLYVASDNTTINGISCQGSLRALNPATGDFIWQTCLTVGPVLGAVTVIPGVAVVTQGNTVSLIATDNGQILNNLVDTSNFSRYFSAVTISHGKLFVGNMNGKFFAYGL